MLYSFNCLNRMLNTVIDWSPSVRSLWLNCYCCFCFVFSGEVIEGFVERVRDDGKIDVSIRYESLLWTFCVYCSSFCSATSMFRCNRWSALECTRSVTYHSIIRFNVIRFYISLHHLTESFGLYPLFVFSHTICGLAENRVGSVAFRNLCIFLLIDHKFNKTALFFFLNNTCMHFHLQALSSICHYLFITTLIRLLRVALVQAVGS